MFQARYPCNSMQNEIEGTKLPVMLLTTYSCRRHLCTVHGQRLLKGGKIMDRVCMQTQSNGGRDSLVHCPSLENVFRQPERTAGTYHERHAWQRTNTRRRSDQTTRDFQTSLVAIVHLVTNSLTHPSMVVFSLAFIFGVRFSTCFTAAFVMRCFGASLIIIIWMCALICTVTGCRVIFKRYYCLPGECVYAKVFNS